MHGRGAEPGEKRRKKGAMLSSLKKLLTGVGRTEEAAVAPSDAVVEDTYTGERVDWPKKLPVDVALRVLLALDQPGDLLAAAHVNGRLRSVFFSRNVWGRWLPTHLPRRLGADCFFAALDDPAVPLAEDPLGPQPATVASFEPYLPWAFGCLRVSVAETFQQLGRGQLGGKDVFAWNQLRTDGGAVAQVALLLPPGSHPPVWVAPRTLQLSRLLLLGTAAGSAPTMLTPLGGHPGHDYNCLTVVGDTQWHKLTERDKLTLPLDQPADLTVECRRIHFMPDPAGPRVFGCRSCGPGASLILRGCRVANSPLSGAICDRGARFLAEDTEFDSCKQSGAYAYECSDFEMNNCRLAKCGGHGVSVSLLSIGTAKAVVRGCRFTMDKETTAVIIRTRARPCNLSVLVEGNTVVQAYTGIIFWPRGSDEDDEDQPARRPGDDPIMECDHGPSCPGTLVQLRNNSVPNPRNHGISLGTPICDSNKTHCIVAHNTIDHCRALGILISMPGQEKSSGVVLEDNQLTDTGEQRVLSFPGLRQCLESHRCSRNVTGKRYEMQAFFRCLQCNFKPSKNLGVCASCAEVCHKGHEGLYLYAVVGAYCDCPERKEKCNIFDKDPLYKEDKPDDL
jgi:hypothetical protein